MHDTNADITTSHYAIRQKHIYRAASAEVRVRTAAAALPVPRPSRATAPAIPAVTKRHACMPLHNPCLRQWRKALAARSSTASFSSSSHRPATRQAGKSSVSICKPVLPRAQASRSATQPGLESCGSLEASRSGLRGECSSSACRRRPRGRRPPTGLCSFPTASARSADRAARTPAPGRTAARPPLRRPILAMLEA